MDWSSSPTTITLAGRSGVRAQELDELDLGDVGVLELVHQDVAELALPAAEDVGARLEQPGRRGRSARRSRGRRGRPARPRRRGRRRRSRSRRRISRAAPSRSYVVGEGVDAVVVVAARSGCGRGRGRRRRWCGGPRGPWPSRRRGRRTRAARRRPRRARWRAGRRRRRGPRAAARGCPGSRGAGSPRRSSP